MKLSLLVAAAAAMTASGAVTKIPMKKTPLTLKGVKEGVWYHRGMLGKLSRDYNLGGSGSVVIQTVSGKMRPTTLAAAMTRCMSLRG